MGNRTMAVRYARALADVLSGDTDLARVQGELDVVAQILRDDKEIHAALLSSGLSRARKLRCGRACGWRYVFSSRVVLADSMKMNRRCLVLLRK